MALDSRPSRPEPLLAPDEEGPYSPERARWGAIHVTVTDPQTVLRQVLGEAHVDGGVMPAHSVLGCPAVTVWSGTASPMAETRVPAR